MFIVFQLLMAAPQFIPVDSIVAHHPPLNWQTYYESIAKASQHNQNQCSMDLMEQSLTQLKQAHHSAQKCATPTVSWKSLPLQDCYTNISNDLHDHFLRQYYLTMSAQSAAGNCVDAAYQSILESIVRSFNADNLKLVKAIEEFGQTNIGDNSFDLRDIYKKIYDALELNEYGCFKKHMTDTKQMLDIIHPDVVACVGNEQCLAKNVESLRIQFNVQDGYLDSLRCYDTVYNPIRDEIRAGLKLSNQRLVELIRAFGDCSLVDIRAFGKLAPNRDTIIDEAFNIDGPIDEEFYIDGPIDEQFNHHQHTVNMPIVLNELLQYLAATVQKNNIDCVGKMMTAPPAVLAMHAKSCKAHMNVNNFMSCFIAFCN